MATKAKKGDKVDFKEWEGKESLMIVDVSAHMRTNDLGDLPENTEMGDLFFGKKKPENKWRQPLSTEIDGEEMVVTSLYRLMSLFKQYGTEHTWVFAFDVGKSFRSQIDKNYKGNRVKMGGYFYTQVNTAYKILKEAGFTVLSRNAMEADDCIMEAVNQNYDYYDKIGIITNDHDVSHLVDDKVSWINVRKTLSDIHMDNYFQQNKCPYNAILLKKTMVGDTANKVKGITRFGEKSFLKFLDVEGIHGENVRGREKEILETTTHLTEEQRAQALYCWKVVEPRSIDIDATANEMINWDILEAFFDKYKFKSLQGIFK